MAQNPLVQKPRTPLGETWLGKQEKHGVMSRYSPQVQSQFDKLIYQLLPLLGGNQFDFGPIEEQARRGFEQRTIPSLKERFTSLGAGGGRSSAFGHQLGQAGVDLELALAAMKQQYGLQRQGLLQNLISLGQQGPYYQPRTAGLLENLGIGTLGGLGRGIAGALGGF